MLRSKLVLQLAFLLLIGSGIVAGVLLVQQRHEIREKAAEVYSSPVKPSVIFVSSELDTTNLDRWNLIDGDLNTSWSSKELSGPAASEWLQFDFGSEKKIATMVITARVNNNQIQAFPKDFHITFGTGSSSKIIPGREFYSFKTPLVTERKLAFTINSTNRYFGLGFTKATTDAYGGYFVQLSEVEFFQSECTSNSQCGNREQCVQGVCGLNTEPYWNLKSGNYWIFQGTDAYGGNKIGFRQRHDSEQTVQMCGKFDIIPWRFSRNVDCPEPHKCYWGNMRFMMADPSKDSQPYIWSTADKRYQRNPNEPFGDTGTLIARDHFWGYNDSNHISTPAYLYTPKFLTDFEDKIEFRYAQNFCPLNTGTDGNVCAQNCSYARPDLIMRYKKVNVNTPAYSGPALVVSQAEKWQWCTREDWYLAPNIGIVRVDQWTCNTPENIPQGEECYDTNGNKEPSCLCKGWYDDPDNHPNCYKNLLLDKAPMIMKLEKYYIGAKLNVTVNSSSTINVKQGDTVNVSFKDPTTGYTYEGYLDTESTFISPDGSKTISAGSKWDTWIGTNGQKSFKVSTNISAGTYKTRFRPHIFTPPSEAIQSGSENVTGSNRLPWSNEVTVVVSTGTTPTLTSTPTSTPTNTPTNIPTPTPTKQPTPSPTKIPTSTPTGGCQPGTVPGDANGDCKVDGFDYVVWWQNFGKNVGGGPSQGDFNRDGKVDGFDYVLWWQNFGTGG